MRNTAADKVKYWNGSSNKFIRYYFYSQRGLALFNEFRYLIMAIFGAYLLLKMSNPVWLGVMFIGSIVVLCAAGWLQVHRMAKVMDWLGVEFATYWSKYSFELQERQVRAIEEINENVRDYRADDTGASGQALYDEFMSRVCAEAEKLDTDA